MKSTKPNKLVNNNNFQENESFWGSTIQSWNRFWFTPADPTILGLVRIGCGLLALYSLIIFSFDFEKFFGEKAFIDRETRLQGMIEQPLIIPPLTWPTTPEGLPLHPEVPPTKTPTEKEYVEKYKRYWGDYPPLPHPKSNEEVENINRYRHFWGVDPRLAVIKGTYEWSVWVHLTDPKTMWTIHFLFIGATLLFTLGLGTRVTSVLAWFSMLCYVHRSPVSLFGYDTMIVILLTYLMLGPSGAAFSLDRWIKTWWRKRKLNFQDLSEEEKEQLVEQNNQIKSSIIANIAIRGLQIHVCFVYAAAGLAKLKGPKWWTGDAVWYTFANYEFAPLASPIYLDILTFLTQNLLVLKIFLALGTYFTLFFEICYPFLIWSPRTRWLMLSMAALLHGFIGIFMGLKTFALVMLVMNMIFLPPHTVRWLVDLFRNEEEVASTKKKSLEPVRT